MELRNNIDELVTSDVNNFERIGKECLLETTFTTAFTTGVIDMIQYVILVIHLGVHIRLELNEKYNVSKQLLLFLCFLME